MRLSTCTMDPYLAFILMATLLAPVAQSADSRRSIEFVVSNRRNDSGHWNLAFTIDGLSNNLKNKSWTYKLNYNEKDREGEERIVVHGNLLFPPTPPEDYVYYPGVGFYRAYPNMETFDNALKICEESGAHLAIINSPEEAQVVKTLFAPVGHSNSWARLGFDDRFGKGDFRTIYGEPLSSTGFMVWDKNEPGMHRERNCGCLSKNGLLGTQPCEEPRYFVCEYDLSWADRSF